jgi:hypothetical protein
MLTFDDQTGYNIKCLIGQTSKLPNLLLTYVLKILKVLTKNMKSIRCPQCGLQNWETSEWCKRCKIILKSNDHLHSASTETDNEQNTGNNLPPDYNGENRSRIYQHPKRKLYCDEVNGFFANSLRSCQRNAMIACGLIVAALLGGLALNSRYFYNAVFGPFTISRDELLSGKSRSDTSKNYVKFAAEDVFDTGVEYVETSKKYGTETVLYKYVALQAGEKFLLAKVDPVSNIIDGATNVQINGVLAEMSSGETEKILAPLYVKQPELRNSFLPYMIDARSDYSKWAYIWIAVGLVLTTVFAGIFMSVRNRFGDIEQSSSLKPLSNYGSPKEVAAMIDSEITGNHEKVGSIYILPTWIIRKRIFTIDIQHIEEIVWVYRKTTKHSVNLIPTGKTHEVVLHDTQGKQTTLNGSFLNEKKTNNLIESIYKRIPWVVAGYDDDLLKTWNSDTNGFIKAVAERRNSYRNNPDSRQTASAEQRQ